MAALLDIGVCLNGLGEFEEAASIITWLRWAIEPMKAKKGKEAIELAEHYEPLELEIHFRAAELILRPVERWDYKNDSLGASDHLEQRCAAAIKECDAGLILVHETNTKLDSYFVYRSSFRIHRARALARRSNFVTAQQDFDRAVAELDTRRVSSRTSLAVRALYLAEALMAWSDYQLMSNCRSTLRNPTYQRSLSPQGRFFVGFDRFISKLAPGLTGPAAKELLRRAMTPWVDCVSDDPKKARGLAEKSLNLIRAVNPRIEDAVADARDALKKENLKAAWLDAANQNINKEQLDDALRRSLAYWSAASLTTLKPSRWDWRRIGVQTLTSVQTTLDDAEGYLTNARRDIQFWYLLHRLRAQACFEELLMMLTLGPDEQQKPKRRTGLTSSSTPTSSVAPAQGYGHWPTLMTTSWTMTIPAPPGLSGSISRSCWHALATNGSD